MSHPWLTSNISLFRMTYVTSMADFKFMIVPYDLCHIHGWLIIYHCSVWLMSHTWLTSNLSLFRMTYVTSMADF